jgi:hypothetical protein
VKWPPEGAQSCDGDVHGDDLRSFSDGMKTKIGKGCFLSNIQENGKRSRILLTFECWKDFIERGMDGFGIDSALMLGQKHSLTKLDNWELCRDISS